MTYYYKVLQRDTLRSLCTWSKKHTIYYKINKWVKGPNPLFVFKRLKDARGHYGKKLIYRCLVKNPREQRIVCNVFYEQDYSNFWKGIHVYTDSSPSGTYVCDEVKLISEVK